MSTNYTLTYSEGVKGWTSFYSYYPEFILGMNQYLYTFKGGNLWRHNVSETRNNYYGEQGVSTITSVFNQEPTSQKLFKTIEQESNDSWDCTLRSDLGSGYMPATYFELKEGSYFSYIRRKSNDLNLALRSAQGIGSVASTTGALPFTVTLTYNFAVGSMVSIGDKVYSYNDPAAAVPLTEIGTITGISENRKTLTIDSQGNLPNGYVVTDGAYTLYIKESVAESYGTLGYFLEFTLENDSTSAVELFNVDSEVFKSNP
jgi:hypothetical protein